MCVISGGDVDVCGELNRSKETQVLVRLMRQRPAHLQAGPFYLSEHWTRLLQTWLLLQSASTENQREREGQVEDVDNKPAQHP